MPLPNPPHKGEGELPPPPTRLPRFKGGEGGSQRGTLAPDISTVGNGLVMPYFFSISLTPGAGDSGSPLPSTGISIQRVVEPSTQV